MQFTNWRLIPHVILTIAGLAPASTMGSYSPTLVRSFGYERLASNALVSIGGWVLIINNLLWGYLGYVDDHVCKDVRTDWW